MISLRLNEKVSIHELGIYESKYRSADADIQFECLLDKPFEKLKTG